MTGFYKFIVCFLFCTALLQGNNAETMKNLELKLKLDQAAFENLSALLEPYYQETLHQTDTYFVSKRGRLKLREERGKEAYVIWYQRPNLQAAKESSYLFYPIQDVNLFFAVFKESLQEELKVKKQRALYFPKPYIRIHLDQVDELGYFLEIEIILSKDVSPTVAQADMRELQAWLQLDHHKKVDCGYRELLQMHKIAQSTDQRDFNYYKNQNKIFWVIANDLPAVNFKRYDVIPCLFVEKLEDGSYGIIQLDPTIKEDRYQYTAWRKLIGQEHSFRAEVLLIDMRHDKLYTLDGKEVPFESLSRSSHLIDKSFLAPFATTH